MIDKLVTIQTYSNPHEADLAKLLLEQEGVPVLLLNRGIVETDWLLSNAVGQIHLQVAAPDADRATHLLSTFTRPRPADRANTPPLDENLSCLECGAPMRADEEACPKCGWTFAAETDP